jgi:hypothetical protein
MSTGGHEDLRTVFFIMMFRAGPMIGKNTRQQRTANLDIDIRDERIQELIVRTERIEK